MISSLYWADGYLEKQRTAEKAMSLIQPGDRVFVDQPAENPKP